MGSYRDQSRDTAIEPTTCLSVGKLHIHNEVALVLLQFLPSQRKISKAQDLFTAVKAGAVQHPNIWVIRDFGTADFATPIELTCTYEDH